MVKSRVVFILAFLTVAGAAVYNWASTTARRNATQQIRLIYDGELSGIRRPGPGPRLSRQLDDLRSEFGRVRSYRLLSLGMSPELQVWSATVFVSRRKGEGLEHVLGMPTAGFVTRDNR